VRVLGSVKTFFNCHGLSRHLFHKPTFLARLTTFIPDTSGYHNPAAKPSSSPKPPGLSREGFPSEAVLHAICAVASLYSPQPGPPAEYNFWPRLSVFRNPAHLMAYEHGIGDLNFGGRHAALARAKMWYCRRIGKKYIFRISLFTYLGTLY